MAAHVFDFTDWYMNRWGDWECDFLYLILTDDGVELMKSDSALCTIKMKEKFPNRVMHGDISKHRGYLECSSSTDKLKQRHREIYDQLDKWCKFKDRRK